MSLSPEVLAILLLDTVFLIFGFFAFLMSINIAKNWDINSTSNRQYALEKKTLLVATIIKYIFYLKLPLFLFFVFTNDKISGVITGAMCAAGVVNSVDIGVALFVFKIINLYIFGFWLVLHSIDSRDEQLKYTRAKFVFFAIAFLFLAAEIFYEFSYFNALNIDKIVSCCGTLFSVASTSSLSFIFELPNTVVLSFFYGLFFLHVIFFFKREHLIFVIVNFLFIIVAIIALILFFGTYIYELPTHHCPFCFLQKDYYYVGYFIYITLFLGTFFGISAGIMSLLEKEKNYEKFYRYSLVFTTIFTIIASAYPVIYFIKNGVWL